MTRPRPSGIAGKVQTSLDPRQPAGQVQQAQPVQPVHRGFLVSQAKPPLDARHAVFQPRGALIDPAQQDQHEVVGFIRHEEQDGGGVAVEQA